MKEIIITLYMVIAVGFTFFAVAYLAMLGIFFLVWLGGVM